MEERSEEGSLASTPTWSVATVMSMFVALSLLMERSIHYLTHWLHNTNRKSLLQAADKMKEELMLLGFISLVLTASSTTISNICIDSKFYNSKFAPCSKKDIVKHPEDKTFDARKLLNELRESTCKEGYEPFLSAKGLEQLHRFIFIMAVTHVAYSCLTMLLAIVKIHTWRTWENQAQTEQLSPLTETDRDSIMQRQSTFLTLHAADPSAKNSFIMWATCFLRQFGSSVFSSDYLALRKGFITNHNLALTYDFHGYMVRSMEEEFQRVVGVSGPLWAFVVAFMLFDVHGSNLYFWMAVIPMALLLALGTKLQHVIATLTLESVGTSGFFTGTSLKPRDSLFWFKKPKLLLSLIHFILFQNAFELASFLWFWWQFGYRSCFMRNHFFAYSRLIIGFFGQFLCSYSTLPLYALVTQMGTNYKAAIIPQRVRQSLHGWTKSTRKKRRQGQYAASTTIQHDTVVTIEEEDEQQMMTDEPESKPLPQGEIELQIPHTTFTRSNSNVSDESPSIVGMPLSRTSSSSAVGNITSPIFRSNTSSRRGSPRESDKKDG